VGDREEGEGSSRKKLVESQGGREGEGDGLRRKTKTKEVEFGIRCGFDLNIFRKSFFFHGRGVESARWGVPRFGVRRRGLRTGSRRALSDQEAGGGERKPESFWAKVA
jgi:hypothetical protein